MVKRHPMIAFFVLAYAFSWWPWILSALGVIDNPIVGFGPFLAALLVLGLTEGRRGIGALLRRMVQWRVGPGWYAVALLLPAAVAGLASMLNVTLGARGSHSGRAGTLDRDLRHLRHPLDRPRLRRRLGGAGLARVRRAAAAGPLVGADLRAGARRLIAGWHLPLIAVGQVHYADVVSIMGATIVINWLFNHVRGSVLLIMILHAANNAISGNFFSPMFTGADSARQAWLLAAVWCVLAVVVVLVGGSRDLSRSVPRQVEPIEKTTPVDRSSALTTP